MQIVLHKLQRNTQNFSFYKIFITLFYYIYHNITIFHESKICQKTQNVLSSLNKVRDCGFLLFGAKINAVILQTSSFFNVK